MGLRIGCNFETNSNMHYMCTFWFFFFFFFFFNAINRVTKYREKNVTSSVSLNIPGARADLPPLELFFDPLLVVITQLINFGAGIPINTSRVQVNYADAT